MMIPGMFAGKIQEWIGYDQFFIWVVISTIPSFLVTFMIPIDPDFGRKQTA
jgi:PAT family beta-lactamase induction signal transducer AmpG